ncbi:MAG: DUF4127 family protein [Clostridia bacterium]|nr:DUF4127 family protein [Clostridia bacterium]
MKVVYLPLDERPCNYYFAGRIAKGSGVEVITPDMSVLGTKKAAASFERISEFLLQHANEADSYVLSVDMLLYGGIIPSRLHHFDEDELTKRLAVLDEIKRINPRVKIYAFALIMRCPSYSSADEEPDYYEYCGREIFLSGQVKHKLQLGIIQKDEADKLLASYEEVIKGNLPDFEARREKNRNMLIRVVERLHHSIDFLIIPQDDSAKYGYTSMDREAIKQELAQKGLDEVAMYPGADEVGMTLLARAACEYKGITPKISCRFVHENSPNITPLYEDRPVGVTLPFQVESAGCVIADGEQADIDLYLNYPSSDPVEVWQEKNCGYEERDLDAFVSAIKKSVESGRVTALADGAYCNGGDRELLQMINKEMGILELSAYAGWNTSSNTLGTVICQAVFVYLFGDNTSQKRFLAERVYEDVGYCGYVRAYVTNNLLSDMGYDYFNAGETDGEVALIVRRELNTFIEKYFTNLSQRYEIDVCRMPWKRMFEVDLSLREKSNQ